MKVYRSLFKAFLPLKHRHTILSFIFAKTVIDERAWVPVLLQATVIN